mgnify:CR=1 FL=1
MALAKAKVQYEDIRVSGESWAELKATGKCMFGQMPLLELDDGTLLTQTDAIIDYLGNKYNLKGADALSTYKKKIEGELYDKCMLIVKCV